MSVSSISKQVYITSNGCNRRLLDADRVNRYFLLNGWKVTESPRDADFNLFFASALNRVRIDESFDIIERLTKFSGETIVLGCLMEVAPTEFRERWTGRALAVKDMNEIDSFFPEHPKRRQEKTTMRNCGLFSIMIHPLFSVSPG